MILHFSYEELRALRSGADVFLEGEGAATGAVLAPPESRARVEALQPLLHGDLSLSTLEELWGIQTAVAAIVECLRAEMESVVVAMHAADELAGAILAGLGYTPESTDVSAPPPAASTRSKSRRLLAGDEPITIQSDELEVIQQDDSRHIIFDRNVLVTQGDVTLRSEKLDAYYSAGASQPDRLVATGRVRVSQGDRKGRCERAVYRRADQTLVCSGRAEVVQGCERLRGSKIEFDLARDRVRVTGAASVLIQPDAADGTSGCAEPSG